MTRIQYIKPFTSWRKLKKSLKGGRKYKIGKEALYSESQCIKAHNKNMVEYKTFEELHDAELYQHY